MKLRASAAVCSVAMTIVCNNLQLSVPHTNSTDPPQFQATQTEKNLVFHMLDRLWRGKGMVTSSTTIGFQFFCGNLRITENCEGAILQYTPADYNALWPVDLFESQMIAQIWGGMYIPGSAVPLSRFPLTMMPQYERSQRDP